MAPPFLRDFGTTTAACPASGQYHVALREHFLPILAKGDFHS
jgi:hypothetical protein